MGDRRCCCCCCCCWVWLGGGGPKRWWGRRKKRRAWRPGRQRLRPGASRRPSCVAAAKERGGGGIGKRKEKGGTDTCKRRRGRQAGGSPRRCDPPTHKRRGVSVSGRWSLHSPRLWALFRRHGGDGKLRSVVKGGIYCNNIQTLASHALWGSSGSPTVSQTKRVLRQCPQDRASRNWRHTGRERERDREVFPGDGRCTTTRHGGERLRSGLETATVLVPISDIVIENGRKITVLLYFLSRSPAFFVCDNESAKAGGENERRGFRTLDEWRASTQQQNNGKTKFTAVTIDHHSHTCLRGCLESFFFWRLRPPRL